VYTPTFLICHVNIKSRSLSPNVIFVGINIDILKKGLCGSCESCCDGDGLYQERVYTRTLLICHACIKSRSMSSNVTIFGINMGIVRLQSNHATL
jgi:hypothetical protein